MRVTRALVANFSTFFWQPIGAVRAGAGPQRVRVGGRAGRGLRRRRPRALRAAPLHFVAAPASAGSRRGAGQVVRSHRRHAADPGGAASRVAIALLVVLGNFEPEPWIAVATGEYTRARAERWRGRTRLRSLQDFSRKLFLQRLLN